MSLSYGVQYNADVTDLASQPYQHHQRCHQSDVSSRVVARYSGYQPGEEGLVVSV